MTVELVSFVPSVAATFSHIPSSFQALVSLHHCHLGGSCEKDPRQELGAAYAPVLAFFDLLTAL